MNLKILLLSFITLLVVSFTDNNVKQKHIYEDEFLKCIYETEHGIIDGKYISYYKNGQKKAEGQFENNLRKGQWSAWDSTGRLRMQREYTNPFIFNKIIPKLPTDKSIRLLNIPKYEIKYNKDGYIDNFYIEERMIVWVKKIWRFIPVLNNDFIFKNKGLHDFLKNNLKLNHIKAYVDDQFTSEVQYNEIDTLKNQLIGYKIKELTFFDNERLVSETRIIGICPVTVSNNSDTTNLYWLYFPSIRKLLAQIKVTAKIKSTNVKTMDDLFFYRMFNSHIYMENDHKSINEKESEKTEIYLIESEHNLWISLTK